MSSFSSVVRKPGQKITPKTAPRRNVQRHPARSAAPPSLTPESQTATESSTAVESQTVTESLNVTPSLVHVEGNSESQEIVPAHTVLESTEIPPSSESVEISLPVPTPLETVTRASLDAPTNAPAPELVRDTVATEAVEVIVPSSTNHDVSIIHPPRTTASPGRANAIPTIATSSATSASKSRATRESTPAQLEVANGGLRGEAEGLEQWPERSSKRQKTTHPSQDIDEVQSRATPQSTDDTHLRFRTSPQHRRSESRTSDALLQDATSQAAAVSELANSIENSVRALRPQSVLPRAPSIVETESPDEEVSEADVPEATRPKKPRKKRQRAKAIEDLARQVVENAVGATERGSNRRLSRLPTPEDAEDRQIDPEEVSMGALVRDNKLGRKSETEKRMQENWEDIKQRRKEEIERRREAAAQRRHGRQALALNQDIPVEETQVHVPQQIIVNGQIVVAAESREVAFGAGVEQAVIEDADVALEDDRIYKYVHQGTLGKHAGQRRGTRWDMEQTELFYKGLRMFGTDFSMIANLFPSLDRKQIKLKFLAEERAHPARVQRSVATKEPVSIDEYTKMTNQQLEDPDALQAELDAEEKRLRDEDERRRTNEGYVLDGADIALPSTERDVDLPYDIAGDGTGANYGSGPQTGATGRQEHIAALARGAVATATAPGKKTIQPRRKEAVGRGRQAKKGRMPMEGVEERLGPIDDIYQ